MDIKDKVAVVTGGASGLGEATVENLLAAGAKVAIFDLNEEKGQALVSRQDGGVLFFKVNVADEAEVMAAVAATTEAFGTIHICVNCAGVPTIGRIVGRNGPHPYDDFKRVIDVNLNGTFNVCRLTAAEMLKNDPIGPDGERGVIVNTSSMAGIEGQMGQSAYAASKAGIIGLILPMTRDLAQFGVRVAAIAPGLFETPLVDAAPPSRHREAARANLNSPSVWDHRRNSLHSWPISSRMPILMASLFALMAAFAHGRAKVFVKGHIRGTVMTTSFPKSFDFAGFNEPVRMECDIYDLVIEGNMPDEIDGSFYRLTPDPQYPPRLGDDTFLSGDGMISLFRFENGHVDMKMRYVMTERLKDDRAARKSLHGAYRNPLTDDPSVEGHKRGAANTTPIWHGKKLLGPEGRQPRDGGRQGHARDDR